MSRRPSLNGLAAQRVRHPPALPWSTYVHIDLLYFEVTVYLCGWTPCCLAWQRGNPW